MDRNCSLVRSGRWVLAGVRPRFCLTGSVVYRYRRTPGRIRHMRIVWFIWGWVDRFGRLLYGFGFHSAVLLPSAFSVSTAPLSAES